MSGLHNGRSDRPGFSADCRRVCGWSGWQWLVRWCPSGLLAVSLSLVWPDGLVGAESGVYTWKDGSGRVHYSNRRPEGQPAEAVELNAQPVTVRPTEHIYTWTDRDGKVHYGAEPPPDVSAKELKEDDSTLSTIPLSKPRAAERELPEEAR